MLQEGRTGPGLMAVSTGLLLPLAYGPAFTSPSWTPRAALVLVVTGVGTGLLPSVVRDPKTRLPALAGTGFVIAAGLSTAFSHNPTLALLGPSGSGTGLVFVGALVAAWALGASTTGRDRQDLATALLAGAVVNATLALAQARFDLQGFGLGLFDARSAGLLGNPVHLAALLAAALALAASRLRPHGRRMALPVAVLAGGLQASGSRIALIVAASIVVGLALLWRSWSSVLLVVLVAAGIAVGSLAGRVEGVQTGSSRLQGGVGDSSTRARLYTWADAGQAVVARPVTGAGPGRYLTATTPYRNLGLARIAGGEGYFRDAHNFVVEYAVTTGLLGLATLAVFLALAIRRARGPLAWFAAAILVVGLVQPLFVGTTPLAFLALGAAGPAPGVRRRRSRAAALPTIAAVPLALLLLTGDARVETARLDGNPPALLRAARWLPPWPETASIAGRLFIVEARVARRDAEFLQALHWHREAVRRDPEDPRWLNDLGALELAGGDPNAARTAFLRALARAPYSRGALVGLARTAHSQGDDRQAGMWLEMAERVAAPDAGDLSRVRAEIGAGAGAGR